ncbi:MAG: diacylglycerol kinase family protein [Coriobacteriaceae bacterium]|jgi:diacylglycerol kinase (ATP)|nr:diacylglycerol kinase family protein [Coriobacteriaceae bacterium]
MADGRFVRNDADKRRHQPFSLGASFRCAFDGLCYAARTQRNMRIHLAFTAGVLLVGAALGIPLPSWPPLLLSIGLVLAAECVNTALESLTDQVSPQYSDLARRAKDSAAAAVMVSALIAVAVGACVFVPVVLGLVTTHG